MNHYCKSVASAVKVRSVLQYFTAIAMQSYPNKAIIVMKIY